jgi:hypothetical protein
MDGPIPTSPQHFVRRYRHPPNASFAADNRMIVGALRRNPDEVQNWGSARLNVFKTMPMKFCVRMIALVALLAGAPGLAFAANNGWQAPVGQALGKTGAKMPGGVYRVGLPRTDLKATLDGVALKPGFALGGWVAFEKIGDDGMMMGDLVLTEQEVNPVMAKLAAAGIEITALHNHLLRNRPFTMYMHVLGYGDPAKLAAALRTALAESKTPFSAAPAPAAAPPPIDLDTAAIDLTLSAKGANNGGVYQFNIPRAEPVMDSGMVVPPAMGSATAINFQPTGGGKAAITGDFVLIASEVNPVLRALRDHGIEVTAIHNHMLDDKPHLYFMHFWANDDARKLTEGLKAALAQINIAKS